MYMRGKKVFTFYFLNSKLFVINESYFDILDKLTNR